MDWSNKEQVIQKIKEDPFSFRYVSKELLSDLDVAFHLLNSNSWAINQLPDEIFSNKEFVLKVMRESSVHPTLLIVRIDDTFRNDEDFLLEAIKIPNYTKYVSGFTNPVLKNDITFVSKAVEAGGAGAVIYMDDRIKNNKATLLNLMKINSKVLNYAPDELKYDPQMILASKSKEYIDLLLEVLSNNEA